jgi:hypothetical protein
VNQFNFWLSKITNVSLGKTQWNSLTSGISQLASVCTWEDMKGEGEKREVNKLNRCDIYYYRYLSLSGPPKEVMIRLHQHHSTTSVYTGMSKCKGAKDYIHQMVNKVCPFWVHGSRGYFHQCLENALAATWRRKSNKENADKQEKGKSPKKDPRLFRIASGIMCCMPFSIHTFMVGQSILHQTADQMHQLILTNTRPGRPYERRQRRSLRRKLSPNKRTRAAPQLSK